jgi:hypothetical protein
MEALEDELRRRPRGEPGFLAPVDNTLSLAGRFYSRLVVSAYREQRITASALADLLGLRLKHLAAIEQGVAT